MTNTDAGTIAAATDFASELLSLAHQMNDDPRFDGEPCRATFAAARAVLTAAGLDGDAIVERAAYDGQWSTASLRAAVEGLQGGDESLYWLLRPGTGCSEPSCVSRKRKKS